MKRVGQWRLSKMLGTGGTATVWLGDADPSGDRAAIKVLHKGFPPDGQVVERFLTEARLLRQFEHDAILRCLDTGTTQGRPWMALEPCMGGSLADGVVASRLSNADIAGLMLEVLDGLGYLHEQGYVHRDVKPENVLIDEFGTARLCDFGIARCPLSDATIQGDQMGSPSFMPPEQMDDPHDTTPQSDIYAVGATLFACVSRSTAFRLLMEESREDALDDLPECLREVVDLATAFDPKDRFVSAAAMADLLADALEEL